jgi:hypothetical protein
MSVLSTPAGHSWTSVVCIVVPYFDLQRFAAKSFVCGQTPASLTSISAGPHDESLCSEMAITHNGFDNAHSCVCIYLAYELTVQVHVVVHLTTRVVEAVKFGSRDGNSDVMRGS